MYTKEIPAVRGVHRKYLARLVIMSVKIPSVVSSSLPIVFKLHYIQASTPIDFAMAGVQSSGVGG